MNATQELRQNGKAVLRSEDGISLRMIFNNLKGRNFDSPTEHRDYLLYVAFAQMHFQPGVVEFVERGKILDKAFIQPL